MSGTRAALAADFLNYVRFEQHLSENTARNYGYDLGKLDRFLGLAVRWQDVDRATLRAFCQHLHEAGFSVATSRRVVATLKAFYRFLRIEGHIEHSPTDDMPRMRVPVRLPRYLRWEQVERLVRAPLDDADQGEPLRRRNHALLELLAATGMRVGELAAVTLNDLDFGAGASVRVYGKGGKERMIPLHPDAAVALLDYTNVWRPLLVNGTDLLFVNHRGKPLSRRFIEEIVGRYARRVGIEQRVYPHLLRHSFATAMVRSGAALPVVQELLGHASIATTAIYTHVSPEHLRESYLAHHPSAVRR